MKKILIIGYIPYGYDKELRGAYPDIIWFQEEKIMYSGPVGLVELVGVFDGVMFMHQSDRNNLAWEVACVMKNVRTFDRDDYPINIEEKTEGENEQLI